MFGFLFSNKRAVPLSSSRPKSINQTADEKSAEEGSQPGGVSW
jgi:hypothetical protein